MTIRTTIILSPHQDDEVIRLAPYIARASDRGDHMILIQATDGSATYVGKQLGLTSAETTHWRHREQVHAWDWLTDGRGSVIRLGHPDGHANADAIATALAQIVATAERPEVYVATWHHDRDDTYPADKHPDHIACTLAARGLQAAGVVVRYAVHPRAGKPSGWSTTYQADTMQMLRVHAAIDAYSVIGYRSTPESLDAARAGQCRVSA